MSRVVVITGASRGLGLSLAQRFIAEGDRVFGISQSTRFWKKAQQSVSNNPNFHLSKLDLTSEDSIQKFVRGLLKKTGYVDILINNAGYGGGLAKIEDTSRKEHQKIMDSNLLSAFLMSKHLIPVFRRQDDGVIVNVSSMAGQRGVPKLFSYSAAKFGLLALSQCIAKENLDKKLKCFTVCPGGMNTEMRSAIFGKEDAARQQSPDFVAGIVMDVLKNNIQVEPGGDIVIRHGKITAIHPCPGA